MGTISSVLLAAIFLASSPSTITYAADQPSPQGELQSVAGVSAATTSVATTTHSSSPAAKSTSEIQPDTLEESVEVVTAAADAPKKETAIDKTAAPVIPYYSQFTDITSPEWQKVSCGVASLAMIIAYYTDAVEPDTLLQAGIEQGAYIDSAGWSHAGLIKLAGAYGLSGDTYGYGHLSMTEAFGKLEAALEIGPVIASVHYTFKPTNPIPHLAVISAVRDGRVYYSDPADGEGSITIKQFKSAWKKRYIAIQPS